MKEEIIISMTSYPPRINGVRSVWESIIKQDADNVCKYVLVLAYNEFPNGAVDLPKDLQKYIKEKNIEIIWHDNILSHKKLIPALKKYPHATILVVDDDVLRPEGWLDCFLNDHKLYPNDIIGGTYAYVYNGDCFKRIEDKCGDKCGSYNSVGNIQLDFMRPANGLGGVLYPSECFQDKRFFDEQLMMRISPTSDESWQYCFNILEDRTFRQLSKVFDYSNFFIKGSQEIKTCLYKRNDYAAIWNKIFESFPEVKDKIRSRQNGVIVSLSSHGDRLEFGVADKCIKSILEQTIKPKEIVLTIYKEDESRISPYIKELIKEKKIRLQISDINLKSHLKYYYTLQHNTLPVITVDDDVVYSNTMIEELIKGYIETPNRIICRRARKINKRTAYNQWPICKNQIIKEDLNKYTYLPTGVNGVLYPPCIFDGIDFNLNEIEKAILVDDFMLCYFRLEKGVHVNIVEGMDKDADVRNDIVSNTALYKINVKQNNNDNYIYLLDKASDEIVISNYKRTLLKGKQTLINLGKWRKKKL